MHAVLKSKNNSSIKMFIDASNIGSGGGINHLKNILENAPLSSKEKNLEILLPNLAREISRFDYIFEVILVDDFSKDKSVGWKTIPGAPTLSLFTLKKTHIARDVSKDKSGGWNTLPGQLMFF